MHDPMSASPTELRPASADELLIVAVDHPSLDHVVADFAQVLRDEPRRFGRRGTSKPMPSLINRLVSAGAARLGVLQDGRIVAMSRVEHDGTATIAVAAAHRGRGVARALLNATIERAAAAGHERIVLQTSLRATAIARLGAAAGATAVDQGCGRVDIVFPAAAIRSA